MKGGIPSVVFRTDASLQIGTGHVMRCLTLADALAAAGAHCHFVCREHPGHLQDLIHQRGHQLHLLPIHEASAVHPDAEQPAHAHWLGCDWQTDANETRAALENQTPDWLVVDHYAIDVHWERALRPHCDRLMVIDDLADRAHDCDLLLDQNLSRKASDYADLVPPSCAILIGPRYALLRPEFAVLRKYSLARRAQPQLRHLLITMGGVDQTNATAQVLDALKGCPLPLDCRITVVMGPHAPWLAQVRRIAVSMHRPTEVLVSVDNIAQIMADSDLAIGAAGSTSWERACLGVPSLIAVLADNQQYIADALAVYGCAKNIGTPGATYFSREITAGVSTLSSDVRALVAMSVAAAGISDGQGVSCVQKEIQNVRPA